VCTRASHRSLVVSARGNFNTNHLALSRCILTDEFFLLYIERDPFSPFQYPNIVVFPPHHVTLLPGLVQSLSPSPRRSSTRTDFSSNGGSYLYISGKSSPSTDMPYAVCTCTGTKADPSNVGQMTIAVIPDEVFSWKFHFYIHTDDLPIYAPRNTWHALVHVCRSGDKLVFASPRRLSLRLEYEDIDYLGGANAWPVLP